MLVRLDRRSRLAALRPSILRVTFDAYNLLNSSVRQDDEQSTFRS